MGSIIGLTDLAEVRALFRYDTVTSRLILAGKNRARRDVLRGLGRMMASGGFLGRDGVDRWDLVTWVPASRTGRRQRGYDQGRILARAVAAELGVPCLRLLVRGRGLPQTGRDRTTRLRGPALRAPVTVRGSVLVIDDVITTGASLDAAGSALHEAGAARVGAAAVVWRCSEDEAMARRPLGAGFVRRSGAGLAGHGPLALSGRAGAFYG